MDLMLEIKITNVLNEINNQLQKQYIDDLVSRTLMSLAADRINLLMTHIASIESKAENLMAENQRLAQIAIY